MVTGSVRNSATHTEGSHETSPASAARITRQKPRSDGVRASGSPRRMADLRPLLLRDRRSRVPVVWWCRLAVGDLSAWDDLWRARSQPSPP